MAVSSKSRESPLPCWTCIKKSYFYGSSVFHPSLLLYGTFLVEVFVSTAIQSRDFVYVMSDS